jgi:hypothetical protein
VSNPVELVALRCLRCSMPVPAESDQVAWACAQCGQGLLLEEEKGLVYLAIHYSPNIKPNTSGHPFWVCTGHVFVDRQAYHDNSERIAREAQDFWGKGRQFFVPAFSASLEELLAQAVALLQKPPGQEEGPPAGFAPVVLSPADLPAAAEFIVLAVEAARKDKLRQAQVRVVLESPSLWILP